MRRIDADEAFPVFTILPADDTCGVLADIDQRFLDDYGQVLAEYNRCQEMLSIMANPDV